MVIVLGILVNVATPFVAAAIIPGFVSVALSQPTGVIDDEAGGTCQV